MIHLTVSRRSTVIRNEGGVMCILIIIWIQQVQTHEGVLAAVTALPDLIKRWPELICIEEATAAGLHQRPFDMLMCFWFNQITERFCLCLVQHVSHSYAFVFILFCAVRIYLPLDGRRIHVRVYMLDIAVLIHCPFNAFPLVFFSFLAAPSLSFWAVLYFGWFHHQNFDLNAKGEFSRWWGGCTDNCSCTRASPE